MEIRLPIHKSDFRRLLCPWAYNEHVNNAVCQVETAAMQLGTRLHAKIASFREASKGQSPAYRAELLRAMYEDAESDEELNILTNYGANDPDLDASERLVEWYFAVDYDGRFVDCQPEQERELNLLLAGRVDSLLYKELWLKVEDLKTGWIFDHFQPEIDCYSLGAMAYLDRYGLLYDSISFVYFWLRTGKREHIDVLKPGESASQLKATLLDRIKRRIEFFTRLEAIPIPGYHCTSCQFITDRCPIGHACTDLLPRNSEVIEAFIHTGDIAPENAPVVGIFLQRLESLAENIKQKFKPWVQAHGPVRIGDTEWAITPTRSGEFNQDAAIKIIKNAGLPIDVETKALKVTNTTLKTLQRDYPEIVKEIYDWCYVEKTTPTLRLRRVK